MHLHTGDSTKNILGQFQGNQLKCLLIADVLHLPLHFHGIFCASGYGLWSFCGHSNPLRYAIILSHARIVEIGLAVITRGTVILMLLVWLLKYLSYCHSHVLHHSYCFHPDVVKLSCSDTKINRAFGLTAIISTAGMDSIFILLSYILIIRSVLNIASLEERKKAFSTCISHMTAVAIFYIPLISLSFVHRFRKHTSAYVPTLTANVYLLIPLVKNLIIYSVKTKQIQKAMLKLVYSKETRI